MYSNYLRPFVFIVAYFGITSLSLAAESHSSDYERSSLKTICPNMQRIMTETLKIKNVSIKSETQRVPLINEKFPGCSLKGITRLADAESLFRKSLSDLGWSSATQFAYDGEEYVQSVAFKKGQAVCQASFTALAEEEGINLQNPGQVWVGCFVVDRDIYGE